MKELDNIRELFSGHHALEAMITHRFDRLERIMAESQDQLNADVAQISQAVSDLTAAIAALKNQPAAPELDFSGLDSAVQQLAALDTANTPAPPPVA